MIPRQEPIDGPAILFADGGASGHSEHDSVASYLLARRLGATGIATELMATADGVAVLRRDPKLGGIRRRRLADVEHSDLPDQIAALSTFYEAVGNDLPLLLQVRSADAVPDAMALATRHAALDRLWLCSSDRDALAGWRERSSIVRLVDSTRTEAMPLGPERHAADLREAGIDAALLPRSEWSGGRTALFHRFGRRCFASDVPHERMALSLLHIGVDGVVSAYPDRLADAAAALARPDAPAFLED